MIDAKSADSLGTAVNEWTGMQYRVDWAIEGCPAPDRFVQACHATPISVECRNQRVATISDHNG